MCSGAPAAAASQCSTAWSPNTRARRVNTVASGRVNVCAVRGAPSHAARRTPGIAVAAPALPLLTPRPPVEPRPLVAPPARGPPAAPLPVPAPTPAATPGPATAPLQVSSSTGSPATSSRASSPPHPGAANAGAALPSR